MEDDRLGKTLAITSLYPENRIRNSRSSLCAFRRSLRETRSSLGGNSSGPYLPVSDLRVCHVLISPLGRHLQCDDHLRRFQRVRGRAATVVAVQNTGPVQTVRRFRRANSMVAEIVCLDSSGGCGAGERACGANGVSIRAAGADTGAGDGLVVGRASLRRSASTPLALKPPRAPGKGGLVGMKRGGLTAARVRSLSASYALKPGHCAVPSQGVV